MTDEIDPIEEVKFLENNIRKYLKDKNISAMDALVIMIACFRATMYLLKPNDYLELLKKSNWDEDKISSVMMALMFTANMTHECTSTEKKENGN